MDASMWVAKTGLDAQQTRMNVISNNLANVNTTGFKRDRAVFEDLLYQNIRQAGGQTGANTQAPTGLMLGTGVRVVATEKTHTQGSLVTTKNALDLAVQGEGVLQIAQPDGTIAYAENPPKKYQDIYPINFDNDTDGIYAEVLRIIELWISRGIKIFRVDNPHTKPLDFWQWLIGRVNEN